MLSVSLVLWVWPGCPLGECAQCIPCTVGVTRELPGEYAQCIPCTVGSTREPTWWVCSVCPVYCGCDQGAYRVSVLSVSLVLWVWPGSLLDECAQCIPCPVGVTREPTGWVCSVYPLFCGCDQGAYRVSMLSVSLVLWVRWGCPLGECAQCVPCTVGVSRELPGECAQCIPCPVGATREPTRWVCSVCPLYCGCDQGAYWVSVLSVSLVLWVWPGSLPGECAQCIPCPVGVTREPTGWVCSVYPLFCGCDQGAYRVSMLSVSLVLQVWWGCPLGECAQCVPCTVGVTRELPGECAQCIPFPVGATREPTGWVCSVCPLYCGCDQGAYWVSVLSVSLVLWVWPGSLLDECAQCIPCPVGVTREPTGWVCSVYPLSCGCYQGAYRVSMLSVSLVLWVWPGSLPGECTQCIPCTVGVTREPTKWVCSVYPLSCGCDQGAYRVSMLSVSLVLWVLLHFGSQTLVELHAKWNKRRCTYVHLKNLF